jgi:hypothetical protein
MSKKTSGNIRTGYCIFINTFFQGPVPAVSDGNGKYIVFETELEAQKEIVDNMQTRLQEFLDGERDFDDAITVEEYVVPVTIYRGGMITDESGKCFKSNAEW